MVKEDLLRAWLLKHLNTPYRWGGDDPIKGFDCSGFVVEMLVSFGVLPHGTDMNAQALYAHWKKAVFTTGRLGALVFYGKSLAEITHVTICIDEHLTVGANGGGSGTTTLEEAAKQDAFIKVRPINYRKDRLAIVWPW